MGKNSWLVPAQIALIAAGIRLAVFFDALDAPFWSAPLVDEIAHLELADRIASGLSPLHGAFYIAPGYAYFLSIFLSLDLSLGAIKVAQLAMGVANTLMLFYLTRRAFGVPVAAMTALVWSLLPSVLLHELLVLKPTLTVGLCLVAFLSLTHRRASESWLPWLLGGAALGLAALVRGELLAVAFGVMAFSLVARHRAWPGAPRDLRSPLLGALACAVVVAPTTVLNASRSGDFVPIAYGAGPNFYIGNHAGADGSYVPLRPERSDAQHEERDAVELAVESLGREVGPASVSRFWFGQGLRWWREEPGDALLLTLKKSLLLWSWWEGVDVLGTHIASRWVRVLALPLPLGLVFTLGILGLFAMRHRTELWPWWAFLLCTHLALLPFFVFERFRIPMAAFALPFAAGFVFWLVARLRSSPRTALLYVASGLLLAIGLRIPEVSRDEVILRTNVGGMLMLAGRPSEALEEFLAVRALRPQAKRIEINIANAYNALHRPVDALRSLNVALGYLYAEANATGRPAQDELAYCHELAGDLLRELGREAEAREQYEHALRHARQNRRLMAKLKRR